MRHMEKNVMYYWNCIFLIYANNNYAIQKNKKISISTLKKILMWKQRKIKTQQKWLFQYLESPLKYHPTGKWTKYDQHPWVQSSRFYNTKIRHQKNRRRDLNVNTKHACVTFHHYERIGKKDLHLNNKNKEKLCKIL